MKFTGCRFKTHVCKDLIEIKITRSRKAIENITKTKPNKQKAT